MPSLFVYQGADQGAVRNRKRHAGHRPRRSRTPSRCTTTKSRATTPSSHTTASTCSVIDLDSSNGTFVNGKRIAEPAQLASGDQVQVGGTLMLFTDPAENPPEDLSDKIDIIGRATTASDASHIVRSMSQRRAAASSTRPAASSPWLARARSNLQVMYRTALAVSHTLDIDQLLQRIMELIFEWVEADRGCIMLMDPTTKALEPKVRHNRQGLADDREAHDQQDDSRLRARAQRGRADQRRPRGRTLGHRPAASCRWASARRSACPCRAATTWWA